MQPSFIRVEADEVTYCLHVLLRFEIELGLVEGSLTVKEVPQVWNSFMQEMLGIVPGHDGEGCLQDVHWSGGAVGYFPTYIIGTVYAAQIHRQLMKEQRDIEAQIRKGDFSLIRRWLEEKVHRFGSTMLADEIITQICKEGLNPGRFVEYLSQKYSGLYQLK